MNKSLFSQRHYVAAADRLKFEFNLRIKAEICAFLTDLFSSDNPRFDRQRFWAACKWEKTKCE